MKRSHWKCNICNNTAIFVSEYTLTGECVVDGRGIEVEGIDSKSDNVYCNGERTTIIEKPYKCAKCGSSDIEEMEFGGEQNGL